MRYPSRLLSEGEDVLAQFRPHWHVLLPALLWAMVLAALVGVAFAAVEPPWPTYAAAAAVLLWLLVAARSVAKWWFTSYVLTTERIAVRSGVLARHGTEIPLENLDNVLFRQTLRERLLGYGDVLVESAGRSGQTRLTDIPDPEAFQAEIYRARELRSLHFHRGGRERDLVEQLEALADLRERGHLTDEEFTREKQRLLTAHPGVPPPGAGGDAERR